MDAHSDEGVFVGYDKYSPAYLVFDPVTQVVRKVRCVKYLSNSALKMTEDAVPVQYAGGSATMQALGPESNQTHR